MGRDSRTWMRKRQVLPCRRIPKLHEATQLLATWALTAHPKVQLSTVTSCHRGQCSQDLSAPQPSEQGPHHGDESGAEHKPRRDEVEGGCFILGPSPKPTTQSDCEGQIMIKRSSTKLLMGTQHCQGPQNQRRAYTQPQSPHWHPRDDGCDSCHRGEVSKETQLTVMWGPRWGPGHKRHTGQQLRRSE